MKKLYIKDLSTGVVREYGKDQHDSLVSFDHGMTLQYYNLQNGDGSIGEYRFCDDCGNVLEANNDGGEYANIGGFQSGSMNEELRNAIETIKKECKSHSLCGDCPIRRTKDYKMHFFNPCALKTEHPEDWEIKEMEVFGTE